MTRQRDADRSRSILPVILVISIVPSLVLGGLIPLAGSTAGADAVIADENETAQTTGIRDVTYGGLGVVRSDGNRTYLLEGERHRLNVTVVPEEGTNHIGICLRVPSTDEDGQTGEDEQADGGAQSGGEELCPTEQRVPNTPVHTESIVLDEWPGNQTGETNLTVTLIAEPMTAERVVDETNVSVHVLQPDEDLSGSGLTNSEELAHGTDILSADTDRDGLSDGEEVNTYGTDPLSRDSAGNGVPDGTEVLLGTDPTNRWTPHSFLFVSAVLLGIGVAAVTLRFTSGDAHGEVFSGTKTDDTVAEGFDAAVTSGIDPEGIRTDEDRVLELLERGEGQLRQKDIVRETDWSKSKVSRVLSRMEEADTVSRIRIGRENIVTYNDVEISEEVPERDTTN